MVLSGNSSNHTGIIYKQPSSFRCAQKEQELQSVNYVRDAVSRYQNQVMNNPSKYGGIGAAFQYQTKVTQPSDNGYNTFTKKCSKENGSGSERILENEGSVCMNKRDEMSFVTAMVKDCQMRQEIQRLQQQQQQQQHRHHALQQHQLELENGVNTKCAIARASLALVSTTDDTDVEDEIEEMKHLENAPSSVLHTNDTVMRSHVKRECDDDLSLASVASLASSSSSFVRHTEQHSQSQQQGEHHHHPQTQLHHHQHQMMTDAFPPTGSIGRTAPGATVAPGTQVMDPLLTSSTHSALSTSTTSSFCFEQPATHVQQHPTVAGTTNRQILQNHSSKIPQQRSLHHSDASVSPESSSTASPSFNKIRTASSATTVSQDSNRDLFFDDEIADQPDLMIMNNNNNNNTASTVTQSDKDVIDGSIKTGVMLPQNRSSLRLSLAKSLDYSSGSSSTTTTMAQESLNPSPLTTPTIHASIRSANSELESLMQQISLTDQDFASLNHCPLSPRKTFYSHREVDRSRSFSFQNSSNTNPSSESNSSNLPGSRISGLKKRHSYTSSSSGHVFRKPRPLSFVENEDGSLAFDSPSMRAIAHDIIGVKTLLFRLQGILQNVSFFSPYLYIFNLKSLFPG